MLVLFTPGNIQRETFPLLGCINFSITHNSKAFTNSVLVFLYHIILSMYYVLAHVDEFTIVYNVVM